MGAIRKQALGAEFRSNCRHGPLCLTMSLSTTPWILKSSQVKSRFTPKMTRKPNTPNKAPLICLFGQPALKAGLAAISNKWDRNEWAWGLERCSNSRGRVG